MFVHKSVPLFELKAEMTDKGRIYTTPTGKYPSVTTILSSKENEGLNAWRKRVGDKEADAICFQAANRGSMLHELCENYVNNELDLKKKGVMPSHIDMFLQLKPFLDKSLGRIAAVEAPLYSKFLRAAGRTDLIAEWEGPLAIIDFKNSTNEKKDEWLDSYWMQLSAYSVMFEELTGMPITKLVLLIACVGAPPVVKVSHRDKHIHDFIKLREAYDV